jgi:tetratricopeptide (TPR) repeat protein
MSDDHDRPPPGDGLAKVIPFARPDRAARAGTAGRKAPVVYATRAHAERDAALAAFQSSLAAFEKLDIEGELARVERAIAQGQPGALEAKAGVRNARACRSFARGDVDAALAEWAEVIAEHPLYVDARMTRATFYRHHGDHDAAIADLDRAAEIDPNNAAVYQNRGDCWDSLGDPDRALANFRRAIQLDPTSAQGHTSVARVLAAQQDQRGATNSWATSRQRFETTTRASRSSRHRSTSGSRAAPAVTSSACTISRSPTTRVRSRLGPTTPTRCGGAERCASMRGTSRAPSPT